MEKEFITNTPNIEKLARHILSLKNSDKIINLIQSAIHMMNNGTESEKELFKKYISLFLRVYS